MTQNLFFLLRCQHWIYFNEREIHCGPIQPRSQCFWQSIAWAARPFAAQGSTLAVLSTVHCYRISRPTVVFYQLHSFVFKTKNNFIQFSCLQLFTLSKFFLQ